MEFIIISLLVVIIAAVLLCKRNQTAYTTPNDSSPLPASQNTLDQELQTRMKEFIRDDRFVLVIQPVMDLKKNSIAGGEMLSRLNHPEWGVIFPDNFLPAIAAAGLYAEFDKYIFRKCCAWLSRSRAEEAGMGLVSCNFSRKTLSEPDVASQLVQIADSYGLPHSSLGIELMEQEAETDVTQFYSNLKKLKGSGFRIILDDFGDGVTSVKVIASQASSLLSPSPAARSAILFAIGSIDKGCPITPVEATITSVALTFVVSATSLHICSAISIPFALQVFALPLLQITAWAIPSLILFFVTVRGAPFTKFLVYTAAADAGTSLIIRARSLFVLFLRIPHKTPFAENPFAAQTPPFICLSIIFSNFYISNAKVFSCSSTTFMHSIAAPEAPLPRLL